MHLCKNKLMPLSHGLIHFQRRFGIIRISWLCAFTWVSINNCTKHIRYAILFLFLYALFCNHKWRINIKCNLSNNYDSVHAAIVFNVQLTSLTAVSQFLLYVCLRLYFIAVIPHSASRELLQSIVLLS